MFTLMRRCIVRRPLVVLFAPRSAQAQERAMRTFNFAATICRVFAIRNNAAAIVTCKRSSHKSSRWHAGHAYQACQAALRFVMRAVATVVRRDGDLMPLGMGQ